MAVKKNHLSPGLLFITLLLAGFILLWLPQRITCHLNFLFVSVFDPFLRLGRTLEASKFRTAADGPTVDAAEYERLWKAYQNLSAQYQALHREYEILARFRKEKPLPWAGLVLAPVSSSVRGLRHELIISRGSDHGLAPGQMVLSEKGDSVLGIVQEVSARLSRVRLLTDSSVTLEVRIRREGAELEYVGRMSGDGKNGCRIPLLSRDYDIREGDVVFAAPQPGVLETPLVVGRCVRVRPDEEHPLLWDIAVRPVEDAYAQKVVAVAVPALSLPNPP
ncbi:MAG: rod shape-determining protein MreC [Anaerohalosphaeraceae bacterium]